MSRTGRNFSGKFKSELVIELFQGEKDLNMIAVHKAVGKKLFLIWVIRVW